MTRIYTTTFAATGDKETLAPTDPGTGKVSLPSGWTPDYEKLDSDPSYRPVGRKEMNGVINEVTAAIGELQQSGFANWQALTGGWPLNARVVSGGIVYRSTAAANTATPPSAPWAQDTQDITGLMPKSGGTFTGKIALSANADLPLEAVPLGQIALLMQPALAASATFTRLTNNIAMTGIVTALGLEIGDVIQITGSTSNNRLHTIESITDVNNVIVNEAHKNGAGSLSLVTETATVTIKRIAKSFNARLGLGQEWVDVTASRVAAIVYTNTTGKPITIIISDSYGAGWHTVVTVNGKNFPFGGNNSFGGGTFIVENNGTYWFNLKFNSFNMRELR